MARPATVSALLIAALLGCGSDAPDPITPASPDPGSAVGVAVTIWLVPEWPEPQYIYSWSDGPARRVTVTRISEPEEVVVWEVVDESGFGIRQDVVHGTVPDGAAATVKGETILARGARYRVSVTLMDDRTGWIDFPS